jgi:putative membrane protein
MGTHGIIHGDARSFGVALACAASIAACEPNAEPPSHVVEAEEAPVVPAERALGDAIGTVHWVHLLEIERGEAAMRGASREDVRAFAERVVRDHRFLDRRLLRLADRMQVQPRPVRQRSQWTASSLVEIEELDELRGVDHDRAFLQGTIDAHDRMVGRFIEAQALADDVLEQTIRSVLPVLAQHRDLAFRLLARMPLA